MKNFGGKKYCGTSAGTFKQTFLVDSKDQCVLSHVPCEIDYGKIICVSGNKCPVNDIKLISKE